jgi:UDP-N-acetyl-D-glucosamine dehydrogenase
MEMIVNAAAESAAAPLLAAFDTLEPLVRARRARIGIMGLGYVGVPLAAEFAREFPVVGFDMDPSRVDCINAGRSHIMDVPDSEIAAAVRDNRLRASVNLDGLAQCDVIIICVPTPLKKSRDPDLSYIRAAAERVAQTIRHGQLVVLESTTYPGTTDEMLLPALTKSGLALDRDFLLAFSPERVDPGSGRRLHDIPKIVGGCSARSTELAAMLYRSVIASVHPVSSARVAETVKLLENTFRLVNVGMINEFAMLCRHLGIDTNEVVEAAATKPFGFMPFHPGPGAGGHCIPLDPLYLSWKAEGHGFTSRFIELADRVNAEMPAYVYGLVAGALNESGKATRDSRILVLGVTYKANIDDTRHSPATAVIDRLRANGAIVAYHDPYVPVLDFEYDWREWRPQHLLKNERRKPRAAGEKSPRRRRYDILQSVDLTPSVLREADCVVILAAHDNVDYDLILEHAAIVVDTRGALSMTQRTHARAEVVRL